MTLGGPIDLTLGSPCDAPPEVAVRAMSEASDTLGPYGRSVGSPAYREAAAAWMRRRLNVDVDPGAVAACVGTKEFVGGLALLLAPLVDRARDVVLVPAVAYPNGYSAVVDGGTVISAPDADELRIRAERGAREVSLALQRRGDLPPLPATRGEPDRSEAALRNLPPIPEAALSRNSLIGHIVVTPGGQALLDSQVPGMLVGMSHVNGWERMTLAGIQQFASATLTDENGRFRLEMPQIIPAFGQPHGHLAYDSGDFETVFLRPVMASAKDKSLEAHFVLKPV